MIAWKKGGAMVSRVNTLQTTPERIEDVTSIVRNVVFPGISGEPGFCGYLVLGSRETGRALGVTLWESEDTRRASEERAGQIRPQVEAATGGTMEAVDNYEVLLFELAR
jgi:heme-degrading monooxygenase HmoA